MYCQHEIRQWFYVQWQINVLYGKPQQGQRQKGRIHPCHVQITGKRCHAASLRFLRPKQACNMQPSEATSAVTTLMYSDEAITLPCVIQYRQEVVPYSKVIFRHILNSKSQNTWEAYFCVH